MQLASKFGFRNGDRTNTCNAIQDSKVESGSGEIALPQTQLG
jgi:hypothetical protein